MCQILQQISNYCLHNTSETGTAPATTVASDSGKAVPARRRVVCIPGLAQVYENPLYLTGGY